MFEGRNNKGKQLSAKKKIHPDVNPNSNTERLSQIVNEAKETALKDVS